MGGVGSLSSKAFRERLSIRLVEMLEQWPYANGPDDLTLCSRSWDLVLWHQAVEFLCSGERL